MVLTPSTMLALGTPAPDFALPDVRTGATVRLADFKTKKALVVIFLCNHCPYVQHIRTGLAAFSKDYERSGAGIAGINANDVASHPEDSPALMKEEAERYGYRFSYLFDESQEVAKAYTAACTPDFFVFDAERKLVYRGQFDGSRPKTDVQVTGSDLRRAVDAVLAGRPVPSDQRASLGCNIKWRPGNEPEYFKS